MISCIVLLCALVVISLISTVAGLIIVCGWESGHTWMIPVVVFTLLLSIVLVLRIVGATGVCLDPLPGTHYDLPFCLPDPASK